MRLVIGHFDLVILLRFLSYFGDTRRPNMESDSKTADQFHMARGLELARQGVGHVEPNPMVGCVLVNKAAVVGEGYHENFGGPHAERNALTAAGDAAQGATAYVTLEPCRHTGKTPPCTEALIEAGISRVVVGAVDPSAKVSGKGMKALQAAGIEVTTGIMQAEAEALIAPFAKLQTTGRPWVIAKWAMTLDGKIASRTGHSQWISGEKSRAIVHELRGRMDAIIVGRQTAEQDDPLLTARPPGPRIATRVVIDSQALLSLESQLVQTAAEPPVLLICGQKAPAERRQALADQGVEVFVAPGSNHAQRLLAALDEMGHRQWTNVLVEGGGELLGSLFDVQAIDEVHAFIAPKLLGGADAKSPLAGSGLEQIPEGILRDLKFQVLGGDVYVNGRSGTQI